MKKENRKKLLLSLLIIPIGIIIGVILLNISVMGRLKTLEKEVELQKKQLNRNVAERVTEIIHDPVYLAGGENEIETETLINTKKLLSSEQIDTLRNEIVKELQAYISDDVYLGTKELLIEDLEEEIREIVTESTNGIFTGEQQELLISTIQREVLNSVSSSIKEVSEGLVSTNKIVRTLETTVTLLKKRVETVENTLDTSVSELENKDKELETAINQLRISFVSSHVGTSDLSMLSIQMTTDKNVLSASKNALENNVTCYSESDKNTYLGTVAIYMEQVEALDKEIQKAIEERNAKASDELAEKAASLSKDIVEFGTMIEESKISIETVKKQLQEQITNMSMDVETLGDVTVGNASKITDLQSAKDSLEQADTSLFAISEALMAADQALEQTSADNLDIALTKITSLVGVIPEGSTVAAQISMTKTDLETAKANLEMAIEEGNAATIAEAESNASKALLAARSEIERSIDTIIGDIPGGETVASLFEGVDTDIEQVREDLLSANNNLNTAKSELQEAIEIGNEELQEAKKDINNTLSTKADKEDLEKVMKAEVTTDSSGKTTISMILEEEEK